MTFSDPVAGRDSLPQSTDTGRVIAADMGFINVSAADYHLTASSPLIGKGVNLGFTRDFDGKLVPATPSTGAFEYASSASSTLSAPIELENFDSVS